MAEDRVGIDVVQILEASGERHLAASAPEVYRVFLLQVGSARHFRRSVRTETFWDWVQAILDTFFSAAERDEVCGQLLACAGLRARPEFRSFWERALAERRLQELIAEARLSRSTASQ